MKTVQRWMMAAGVLSWAAWAAAGMNPAPAKPGTPGLERIKQLIGTWEAPNPMDPKGVPVKAIYESTAAGYAVTERLFVGTPGEMTTVYYDQDGRTTMTHYCSVGNRPIMALKSMGKGKMSFELVDGSVPAGEPHMHTLTLAFPDATHLEATWSMRDPKGADQVHPMKFVRKT